MLNIKKIIISLVLVVIFLFTVECCIFHIVKKDLGTNSKYTTKMTSYDDFYKNLFKKKLIRPIENYESELSPIVIFGCSFAYGDGLNERQTFSHKLAKYVNNPIYNFSYGGWSVANMLYQIEHEPILKDMKEPESVIYVFVPVQKHRLFLHVYHPLDWHLTVHYKIKDNMLKQSKIPPVFFSLYTIKKIDNMVAMFKGSSDIYKSKRDEITKLFFKQSLINMKANWKNTKFYIFNFSDYTEDFLYELEQETDWKLIDLSEFEDEEKIYFNKKYTISEEDKHPNEAVWDIIAPLFFQKI